MNAGQAPMADAGARLRQATLGAGDREVLNQTVARFDRFCREHGFTALPALPQTVLRYMHVELASSSPATLKRNRASLVRHHLEHGHHLSHPDLADYIRGRRRSWIPPVGEELHSLTGEDIEAIAYALRPPPRADATGVAAALELARRFDRAPAGRQGTAFVPRKAFTVAPDGPITCSHGGKSVIVEPDDPFHAELLLALEGPGKQPLRPARPWQSIAKTAGLPLASLADPQQFATLSEDVRRLLVTALEPGVGLRLRRLARLLVMYENAARHSDLSDVFIEHVRIAPDGNGFLIPIHRDKTHQNWDAARWMLVAHTDEHDHLCQGCAMGEYLDYLFAMGRTSGELFAVFYRNKWRYPTRQAARHEIKAVSALAGVSTNVAVRSIRRGAAVGALEAGVSLEEVREMLRHKDIRETLRYLRDAGAGALTPYRRR